MVNIELPYIDLGTMAVVLTMLGILVGLFFQFRGYKKERDRDKETKLKEERDRGNTLLAEVERTVSDISNRLNETVNTKLEVIKYEVKVTNDDIINLQAQINSAKDDIKIIEKEGTLYAQGELKALKIKVESLERDVADVQVRLNRSINIT